MARNWKRSFKTNDTEEHLQATFYSLNQITDAFQSCGFERPDLHRTGL